MVSRSRWASTIAPSAAVINRADVASKANTYRLKIRAARPCTLPPLAALASVRPSGSPTMAFPVAKITKAPNPTPASAASGRWPLIVSTRESAASTPTSIRTNKKSIKIAPV